jgi:hypothetical protein
LQNNLLSPIKISKEKKMAIKIFHAIVEEYAKRIK